MTVRLLDEAVDHGQTETAAFSFFLGREEWLKHLFEDVRRDPCPRVRHRQHDILPRLDLQVIARIGFVEEGVADFYGQLTGAGHRVTGVDREIEDGVFELARIDGSIPQTAGDDRFDFNRLADRPAQKIVHSGKKLAEMHHLRLKRLAAAKRQQLACELSAAADTRERIGDPALRLLVSYDIFCQEIDVAGNDLQQVVEVVGDTAGQLADRLHLLGLLQSLLHFEELCGSLLDARLEIGGAVGESHLRLFLIVDIGIGADPVQNAAVLRQNGNGASDMPAIGAIIPAQPKLGLIGLG